MTSGEIPNVPDRIVIYIDDLDRCTPAQVYAVLQAIHLLLAFNLFVVVVGVDVAWVQEALVHELRPTLNVPTSTTRRAKSKIDERKLAIRYLEKIFQLPFWLRRLTTEGADGGSYGRFIQRAAVHAIWRPRMIWDPWMLSIGCDRDFRRRWRQRSTRCRRRRCRKVSEAGGAGRARRRRSATGRRR